MILQDKIGRQDIVDKICGLVDSLKKDQNFCLSINGAWGSGKSFVLQMIEEQLSNKLEYIIVKYDAWKNNFYSDPLIAMLYCILDTLENTAKAKDIRVQNVLLDVAKEVGSAVVATVAEKNKVAGFIVSAINKIKSIIQQYKKSAFTNNQALDDFKSYASFLNQTIQQLNEITSQEVYEGKQTKLIVLVDEIDRCLPNEQLVVLERLHHLFDIENCAVIVAMNQQCVSKTVQSLYGTDGQEYLRKFFNLTFKLDTSASIYFESLLKDFVSIFDKLEKPHAEQELPTKLAYQCLLNGTENLLDKIDNREVSRLYDSLLNVCNDFGWEKLTQQHVFFVIIALFIRKNISATFLSEEEIIANQSSLVIENNPRNELYDKNAMPYFDYLNEYIGIDRENLPESIYQRSRSMPRYIPEFSWYFNEITYYSLGKDFHYNQMRVFFHQPTVKSEDCQKLRQLIILYGGEQEKCDR